LLDECRKIGKYEITAFPVFGLCMSFFTVPAPEQTPVQVQVPAPVPEPVLAPAPIPAPVPLPAHVPVHARVPVPVPAIYARKKQARLRKPKPCVSIPAGH
jgi:hypothetical protein